MVLYFSATGNTKYIAQLIAKELGDDSLDLLTRIREKDYSPIASKKPFVICSPVYVCEMPIFFMDYLKKLPLRGSRKVYFVFTSGGYAGISGMLGKRIAEKKRMRYMGRAELTMPKNYIATDAYPELEEDEIIYRIENCTYSAKQIALSIRNGRVLKGARHVFLFEKAIILPYTPVWVRFKQGTKDFTVSDKCVGCGKCASLCPLKNIRLKNKKPEWINASCAHCMACINNCPVEAIEYGNITQKKVKYNINKFLKKCTNIKER